MARLTAETHGKKPMVVTGDTLQVKDLLKECGGSWHKDLNAWIFPGSKADEVLQDLAGNSQIREVKCVEGPPDWAFPGSKKSKKQNLMGGTAGGSKAEPSAALAGGDGVSSSRKRSAGQVAGSSVADGVPPSKRCALGDGSKFVLELSNQIRAIVCVLDDGTFGVDVRKFQGDAGGGAPVPTQKGVRLIRSEWRALREAMSKIDRACEGSEAETKVKVTVDIVVIVRKEGHGHSVELQRNDGEKQAAKRGLRMAKDRWDILRNAAERIDKEVEAK